MEHPHHRQAWRHSSVVLLYFWDNRDGADFFRMLVVSLSQGSLRGPTESPLFNLEMFFPEAYMWSTPAGWRIPWDG